jgi:hypothetical protein
MAYLMAPQPSNITLPVFFNVNGVVGAAPASNKREDVLLVQFAFKVIGDNPIPGTGAVLLAAAKAVAVTGTIRLGFPVDPTINAIRVLQQDSKTVNPGTVVDGRVSPAKAGYDYGAGVFTIVDLNNSLQLRHVDIWPRIDKIPGCPNELKQMVIRTVAGT